METEADHSSLHINSDNIEKRVTRHDEDDVISALPDDILFLILKGLDLRTAVKAGATARRWRRLPRLITDLDIDVATLLPQSRRDFSVDRVMAAYADATAWFLLPPPDTQHHRKITNLRLAFYLAEGPYLRTIGDTVAAATTADFIEFDIRTTNADLNSILVCDAHDLVHEPRFELGQRLAAFLTACPATFAQLTSLALQYLDFSSTTLELAGLLDACHRLESLSLSNCVASVLELEIDAPCSSLVALELHSCSIHRVELTRVPKLERLLCDAATTSFTSIRFRSVPRLRAISLSAQHLYHYIKNPALLSPAFSNLRDVRLCHLDNTDMAWILFLLQAAPLLNSLSVKMSRSWFTNGGLYKSLPNIEHRNLTSLEIKAYGISQDTNVKDYIGIIRKCAVYLKNIRLLESCRDLNCDGVTCLCKEK